MRKSPIFGTLIKKHRLLSGIATIHDLVVKLAEEGFYMEDSTVSHWQIGDRVPHDRDLIIGAIKIFVREKGIKTSEEANQLMSSTDLGYLTSAERKHIFPNEELEPNIKQMVEKIRSVEILSTHYLQFLQQAERGSFSFYNEIETEKSQILSVLDHCMEFKLYGKYLSIWNQISPFFWDRGYWEEFEILSKKAYGIADILDSKQEQARCLVEDLSWLYYWSGRLEDEEKLLNEADAILLNNTNKHLQALYLLRKGLILKNKNQFSKANSHLTQAHSHYKQTSDSDLISKSALYLGHLRQAERKYDEANKYYKTALRFGKLTKNENEAKALYYLGEVSFQTNRKDKAASYFTEALEKDTKDKRISGYGWNLYGLARCSDYEADRKKLASKASDYFRSLSMLNQATYSDQLADNRFEKVIF